MYTYKATINKLCCCCTTYSLPELAVFSCTEGWRFNVNTWKI